MNKTLWAGLYLIIAIGFSGYNYFSQIVYESKFSRAPEPNSILKEGGNAPFFHSAFVSGNLTKEVHSATAVSLSNGELLLFWYGGEREGSADVAIYSRRLNTETAQWGNVRKIVERQQVAGSLQRNIRKLGNPIAYEYGQNEIWLFFVSVSVGGWAGSSINLQKSFDNGETWGKPQRLITSPFLNISTLVKERPIRYQDGSIGLPVYHEFLGKFAELLHLDQRGQVVNKYRMSKAREAIQPVVIPRSESQAIALMRNVNDSSDHRLWYSQSADSGKSWQPLEPLQVPNPNAAVTAIPLDNSDLLLMVFNNHPSERIDLTLALSMDAGKNWNLLTEFEKEPESDEHNPFSYPFLVTTNNEQFHLFYTWKRKKIKYVVFNQQQLLSWIKNKNLGTKILEVKHGTISDT